MRTWIALLRGVNVVGANKLPMKELVAVLERAGFSSVRTYIQSGNVIFESSAGGARALATRIARLVRCKFGFEPKVMVISRKELERAVRDNPFPGASENHKSLHLFFLSERPRRPDL